MKRYISFVLSIILTLSVVPSVFAADSEVSDINKRFSYNYQFDSGADTKETFGEPTQTDEPANNPEQQNIRRNKDASHTPPGYGVFSGEIPTDQSSPYHENVAPDYAEQRATVTNESDPLESTSTGVLPSTSTMTSSGSTGSSSEQVQVNHYPSDIYQNTIVTPYADGSIGTLYIPKLNKTIKVYEGESLDNMKKGVGHFEFTSSWESNVGIAGHNRGSAAYLNGIWNLKNGDEIIYTTKLGQRTYKVFNKEKIDDTDYSTLGWSNDNMITLITCVENVSNQRWSVQAIQQ